MALGPGELDNQLVAGTTSGDIKYVDFRMTSGQVSAPTPGEGHAPFCSARMGVWKTVHSDERAPISAFAAQPYSPLLATSSLTPQSQVPSFQRTPSSYCVVP